ncbi:hypothetical protein SAMN05444365_107135 [Micromonospora pattaloongensis]|uniref:SpoVT-AbrB domain-containing protein n=1 Tax=Micromonospora pattaloongensis TaxID=405436 RepID=A0A1H3RAD2_9ACTN|nr:hypothetical protein [Micromonospora pattaloongensis]SDZ21939.1 hypothetical protein SAMN05444365_107135 [Micromonospora pattaloongensis]
MRRVDLPALPTLLPAASSEAAYGLSRVDDHGRLRDAKVFAEMGWTPGTAIALTLTTEGHLLLAQAAEAPAGSAVVVALDSKGRLSIPLALREALFATAGSPVLLRADIDGGTATVYSQSALDRVLGVPSAAAA